MTITRAVPSKVTTRSKNKIGLVKSKEGKREDEIATVKSKEAKQEVKEYVNSGSPKEETKVPKEKKETNSKGCDGNKYKDNNTKVTTSKKAKGDNKPDSTSSANRNSPKNSKSHSKSNEKEKEKDTGNKRSKK